MTPTWLRRRQLVPPTALALVLLCGCGSEPAADDAGTGVEVSAGATTTAPATSDPGTPATTAADAAGGIGSVLINAALDGNALEQPADVVTHVEVAGADELAATYADVAGIEPVVAAVAADPPADGERLFVYVVAACTTDDVALRARGDEVVMVVSGTSTLKCEPPPLQMVVWKLGADEVPASAVPGQAIQK